MSTQPKTLSSNHNPREIDIVDFTNVEVDCTFRVEIIKSDTYHVSIKASEKYYDHINVTKSGSTLKLSLKSGHFKSRPVLEAYIGMPVLNKLRMSGATRGKVKGFESQEKLDINVSGSSVLNIEAATGDAILEISGASRIHGMLKSDETEMTLSGSSKARLQGSATKMVLNAWGASHLDLADYLLKDLNIHLKGASKATINVDGNLEIDLSGASKLYYTGNPKVNELQVSGASRISRK